MQKVMSCTTQRADMRAPIDGWTFEDGDLVVAGKMIGYTGSPIYPCYATVLHAIGDGWRLLAPPHRLADDEYDDAY